MKRREFLKRGAIVAAGTAAAAASGVTVVGYAAGEAVKLAVFDQHEGATLLKMAAVGSSTSASTSISTNLRAGTLTNW